MVPRNNRDSLFFVYKSWRRAFEKRTPLQSYKNLNWLQEHNLHQNDLEDTIDRATQLLQPYRGWIGQVEIIKNIIVATTCTIAFTLAISLGVGLDSPLAGALIAIIYCAMVILAVYFMKFLYSRRLRQANFLLAVFCRAENNRHYLKLNLELRPGFLGKWIEVSPIKLDNQNPDIPTMMRNRFLKPANELRNIQ